MKKLLVVLLASIGTVAAAQAATVTLNANLNTDATAAGVNQTQLFHACYDTTSTAGRTNTDIVVNGLTISDVVIEKGNDFITGVPYVTIHAKNQLASFRTVFKSADGAYCDQGVSSITFAGGFVARTLADFKIVNINGSSSGTTINGTTSHEFIRANGGNDIVNAGSGHDILNGDAGNDDQNGSSGKF